MAYMKIIENTSSWTCPKTADYEIICVAGGQGGGATGSSTAVVGEIGESTSFGSHLTASGVWGTNNSTYYGGSGGYTLFAYGGHAGKVANGEASGTVNGGTGMGLGYGAGGKGGGGCGRLKTTFVTINQGTVVNCIVGNGGAAAEKSGENGEKGVIVIREV